MEKTVLNQWKKLALALAILIVVNIFFNVGVETFYEIPAYEDFCSDEVKMDRSVQEAETMESCLEKDGMWTVGNDFEYCEMTYDDCWAGFREELAPYNRNAFFILVTLGVITLFIGMFAVMPVAVSNGLLYGGVLSIIIGTMRYWADMDGYLRFIVSGVVLAILVLVGIKKVKD